MIAAPLLITLPFQLDRRVDRKEAPDHINSYVPQDNAFIAIAVAGPQGKR